MKLTLSIIKADIGSIGGHIAPSQHLLDTVRAHVEAKRGALITDYYISHTDDDIAVLMTHRRGAGNADIHQLAWDAFVAGTAAAKQPGLYGRRPGSAARRIFRQREGHGPGGGRDGIRRASGRAVPVFRRRQDRSRRVQSAALPRLRRPHEHPGTHPLAAPGQGLPLRHHGRQLHRGRPHDRTQCARGYAARAGVAFHVGSQCRNLENWRIGVENAKLIFDMMRKHNLEPCLLNIGGGFPVRHVKPIPAIEKIGATVNAAIGDLPSNIRVMAESGRFLVSDCAWLVSRVIGTAVRHGTRWVYLDTGIFHGMMEAIEGLEFEIRTDRHGTEIPCTVAGPICDSVDVIIRDRMLPAGLAEGDYVYIPNTGAYSVAYATQFNGFPSPDTVVLQHVDA